MVSGRVRMGKVRSAMVRCGRLVNATVGRGKCQVCSGVLWIGEAR